MTISVFGNPTTNQDSLLVNLLPQLRKSFPKHTFLHQDPTEDLKIPQKEWWILDVVQGIKKITVFGDLDKFQRSKSLSVHDYDLYLDLQLKAKLDLLPPLKIIAVPPYFDPKKIIEKLKKIL